MKYDEVQHAELLSAFKEIKKYLENNNVVLGYYTPVRIDSYLPNSDWFRFIFSDRYELLKYIKPVCNILDKYENIHYDVSYNSRLFVSLGKSRYRDGSGKKEFSIDDYLLSVSDTHDELYDRCLFKHCQDLDSYIGAYSRDNLGFIVGFSTFKAAQEFDDKFPDLFPSRKIDWLPKNELDKYYHYSARIIMYDKLDMIEKYRLLSRPKQIRKKVSAKPNLLSILADYKPNKDELENYNKMLELLK